MWYSQKSVKSQDFQAHKRVFVCVCVCVCVYQIPLSLELFFLINLNLILFSLSIWINTYCQYSKFYSMIFTSFKMIQARSELFSYLITNFSLAVNNLSTGYLGLMLSLPSQKWNAQLLNTFGWFIYVSNLLLSIWMQYL